MTDPPSPAPTLTVDGWRVIVTGLAEDLQDEWNGATAAQRVAAAQLAVFSLFGLTAGQVEPRAYVVRPCSRGCTPLTYQVYPVAGAGSPGWRPALDSGTWINVRCGECGSDCCRHSLSSIRLAGATAIGSVWVDGALLDPSAYRLMGDRLVRLADEWPSCQDLDLERTAPGTFEVTYFGNRPGPVGEAAAGRLALEYLRALLGSSCALPASVTSVIRAGTTITRTPGAFPGGLTGIREVDAWVSLINPNKLTAPSEVLSPDTLRR